MKSYNNPHGISELQVMTSQPHPVRLGHCFWISAWCVDLPGPKAQQSSIISGGDCELINLATGLQARAKNNHSKKKTIRFIYTFKTEKQKLSEVYLDLHIIEPPAFREDNLAKKTERNW